MAAEHLYPNRYHSGSGKSYLKPDRGYEIVSVTELVGAPIHDRLRHPPVTCRRNRERKNQGMEFMNSRTSFSSFHCPAILYM